MRRKIDRVRKDLEGVDIAQKIPALNINIRDSPPSTSKTSQHGSRPPSFPSTSQEPLSEKITRITADLNDLTTFYNTSSIRHTKLHSYLTNELALLRAITFKTLDQESKIDYILLKKHLKKQLKQLRLDAEKDEKASPLFPFAKMIVKLIENRQQMVPIVGEKAAQDLTNIETGIRDMSKKVKSQKVEIARSDAYRAANTLSSLTGNLKEWYSIYVDYDPMFTWWCSQPFKTLIPALEEYIALIKYEILGIGEGDEDTIVGEPIGEKGLLAELEAEFIPYSPDELLRIAEKEYEWCLKEMKEASRELGFSDEWKEALKHVQTLYVPLGHQPQLVQHLAREAISYVKHHDLVTVPPICESTFRTFMMTPARQKVNPFFLGGSDIIVSYPTSTMSHEDKMISMRGNNEHFSRATVFHEMIPGHHLQFYYMARSRPYRQLFETPFYIEGWALYWEFLLWTLSFPRGPEDKVGMLFWRMHRCIRIVFSLRFHLGEVTPEECIDMLVERVGHERATAEGEVRRSFNGDYGPLYQVGYMIGALQLWALREEVLGSQSRDVKAEDRDGEVKGVEKASFEKEGGKATKAEKEFHDRIMRANMMPIELLRALIKDDDVDEDYETRWRFYGGLE